MAIEQIIQRMLREKRMQQTHSKRPGMLGEKNHQWKGGRIKREGYIHVLRRGHPFADARGYVLEHRLVMEKHIGAYIPRHFVVHHINGIKDDNRLENLQLMTETEHKRLEAFKGQPWRWRMKRRQTHLA